MFPFNTSIVYSRFLCTNCKLHSQTALLNASFKAFRTILRGYHKNIGLGATLTNVTELFGLHPFKFHQSKLSDNRVFRREYHAFQKLLQRSSLLPREHIPKLQVLLAGNLRAFSISSRNLATPKDDKNKKDKKDDDEDSKMPMLAKALLWMMTSYMVIMMLSLLIPGSNQSEVMRFVSWNEFVHHMLSKGEVEELIIRPELDLVTIILHDNAMIKDKPAEHKTYHMQIINTQSFEEKLRKVEQDLGIKPENGVPLIYERNQESAWLLLLALVAVALMILMMSRGSLSKSSVSADLFPQLRKAKFTIVDPLGGGKGVRFKDVAGLKEAKQEIMEFVDYLKKPHIFKELGAKIPRGALLLGPPGCGKTLLAKAVATEANVPFLVMAGSEFIEMIGGLGAARVRDLFKEARKRAPCIVYIDEVDAIGRKRSGTGKLEGISGEEEQTLNQLLVEMDGMTTKEEVIILASTNRAEVLDKALLRPGRFDRHILIDFPTLQERKEIFELHLKSLTLDKLPSTYSSRMAQLTPGFSGADIANICNEAALNAARHNEKVVTLNNLEYAVERVIGGTEKRSKVLSDEEKRMVAYHESGHALVGWLLKFTDALLKISIVPRTNLSLGYAQYVPQDQKLYSSEELFERMCMALGGRVAETITFNRCSTGAEDDLKKVTKLAYAQIKTYGMNDVIGLVSFPDEDTKALGRKPYSKKLAYTMDEEVRRLVAKAYKTTEELLINNKNKLELIAKALIEKEVLNYEDIEKLIGPPPFGKKRLIEPIALEMMVNLEDKNKEIRDEKRETSP